MSKNISLDNPQIIEYKKTNIYIIENVFSDELCEELIDIINKTSKSKTDYHDSNNVRCFYSNYSDLLKCDDSLFYKLTTDSIEYKQILDNINNKKDFLTNNMNGLVHKNIVDTFSKVNEQMKLISKLMKKQNPSLDLDHNSDFTLRKIYGETRRHTDGIKEVYHSNIMSINENYLNEYRMVRNATLVFALNDDYQGGIFKFDYHNVSFKMNKGSVLIFPPYWTHPHEVSDLLNDTFRYTLSTWCCQKI